MDFYETVEHLIAEKTGTGAAIASRNGAAGGCINQSQILRMDDGRRFFLKSNPAPLPHMFEREAEGLIAMGRAGAIRVPAVIGFGGAPQTECPPFILMELIESGRQRAGFFEIFGRELALMHQRTAQDTFGFEHDNYIGSTPQPNGWMPDWIEFWRERRLGFQLRLAGRLGQSDGAMQRCGERLLERLPELIGEPAEPACLLHGDLWGGNYMTDQEGSPVLIDPAAYYGRREADLAMTMLFGGFSEEFYAAYHEVWPLAEGSAERLDIYKLYHLLNHLNLFGPGYYSQCMTLLRRYGE